MNIRFPYENKGVKDRTELLKRFTGGRTPTQEDANAVQRFIESLAETVGSRRRTVFPGLGTFQWTKSMKRIPTGETVRSWHLGFHLVRSANGFRGRK